jgi:DNA primase
LNTFRIGYADRTLGLRLPYRNRKEGAELRGRLERLGIYRESGHEHFNGSVVFPVMDETGLITGIYGRKILNNLREGTAYHTYLPGPHHGFWNPQSLAAKEIILCEAIIDALSFWTNGFRNVAAAYGVNGFTDEMLKTFIDRRVRKVYIAFDRDEAGDTAAERTAKTLIGEGIECLRVQFPKGMDANEYACSMKPAAKGLCRRAKSPANQHRPPKKSMCRAALTATISKSLSATARTAFAACSAIFPMKY